MSSASTVARERPLLRFLGLAAAVWVLAFLPVGLWSGDALFVLKTVSRETWQRQLYQGLLYGGLALLVLESWWRYRPKEPPWGRPALLLPFFALGFGQNVATVFVLVGLGSLAPQPLSFSGVQLAIWLASCLAVGLVEEALFRGFLLGRLAGALGFWRGALLASLLFAAVHLFRPGSALFKLRYGLGLFLLGLLLALVAWRLRALWASVGLHSGLILPNMAEPWSTLEGSWWAGIQAEPLSGALSWAVLAVGIIATELIGRRTGSAGDR